MKKSRWMLAGFMLFNTACLVEGAFPGWSALYTSMLDFAGGSFELVAVVSDHWINRHGVYFPTYPDFQFVGWSDAAVYLTLGLLVRLLVKSELELRALRRERREREAAALPPPRAETAVPAVKTPASELASRPGARSVARKNAAGGTADIGGMTEEEWQNAIPVDAVSGRLGLVIEMAILKDCWLVFDYDDQRFNHTRRCVKPLRVISYRAELYVQGFCRLRRQERTFKLSRMDSVLLIPNKSAERKRA